MTATATLTADEQKVSSLIDELLSEFPPRSTEPATFLGAQFDKGLAWVHFEPGHGGLGLNPKLQRSINERLFAAGAPNPVARNPIGHGMCGPTVAVWGSAEQKKRYLRPLFTGEEVWCQLFSEPGSGSDFAGLSAKGIKDGDEWIMNGQKVWTTLAHLSRFGLLIVRTDPEAVKHAGLISLTTLMNERVSIGGAIPAKGSGPIRDALKVWKELPADRRDAATRDELMSLWIRAELLRLTNIRASQNRKMGDPGPEGSIAKLAMAELNKDIYSFAVSLLGADGMLFPSGYQMIRPEHAMGLENPQKAFLRSRANSIEGGTSEVMRNILGERVLGLPGDVRVDRDVAWSKVPRN
ncbi:MAG: acyl-CoA dehydrogenase [Actinobacteria bacterium]|nr:acyl-CoA dehydrogenase [Actinomycetota bacterium]